LITGRRFRAGGAKVKTDKIDVAVHAELLAANFLPAVWTPVHATYLPRRLVVRRTHGGLSAHPESRTQVQAVLHRNLIPRCPAADLFGREGSRPCG
jgi:transposase